MNPLDTVSGPGHDIKGIRNLGFGSYQTRTLVWQLPNSGLAAVQMPKPRNPGYISWSHWDFKYNSYDIMDPFQDEKIAAMVAAAMELAQVSCCYVFKHQTKDKSRLQPYGLALVTVRQVVVPSNASHTFT